MILEETYKTYDLWGRAIFLFSGKENMLRSDFAEICNHDHESCVYVSVYVHA